MEYTIWNILFIEVYLNMEVFVPFKILSFSVTRSLVMPEIILRKTPENNLLIYPGNLRFS